MQCLYKQTRIFSLTSNSRSMQSEPLPSCLLRLMDGLDCAAGTREVFAEVDTLPVHKEIHIFMYLQKLHYYFEISKCRQEVNT